MFEIETKNILKTFGKFVAVDDVNLQITSGTIFGFLGPNGSGKSTMVKLMTGVLAATKGEVIIRGVSIKEQPIRFKREIGVVPEDLALFDFLTIWEHLLMCGSVFGLSRPEVEARATQLLKYLSLWESRSVFIQQSSYGMKKKCALAMALIHNPKILFLDEPFEGIDPISAYNIKELLLLLSSKGVTIFITSHILDVVEKLVQRFAIISHGKIICQKSIAEIVETGENLESVYFSYVPKPSTEEISWLG